MPNSLEHSHSYFRNSQPNERNSLRFFTNSKFENNNNKNSFINNYVEKCDILKIKCKCIQILNRLVCLVSLIFFLNQLVHKRRNSAAK
jgi:hypothetical protein